MNHPMTIAFLFAMMAACGGDGPSDHSEAPLQDPPNLTATPGETVGQAPGDRPVEPPISPEHGGLGPGAAAPLEPPSDAEPFVRARRRMNIDQLRANIARTTGGLVWRSSNGKDQLEVLSDTLGKPDYISRVAEDMAPSPVFQKFLGDAARTVCTELVATELEQDAADRILMRHVSPEDTLESAPDAVNQNLRGLVLRFHGSYAASDDAPILARWRWLFTSVSHVTDDPTQAWRAVCIGLMTHPYFYSY